MGRKKNDAAAPYEFISPEAIDAIVLSKLNDMPRKGGKGASSQKWTENELLHRNRAIIEYVCQGLSKRRIKEELMARWHITENTATEYINIAYEKLVEDNKDFIEKARQLQLEKLQTIAEDLINEHNYGDLMKVLDMENKINGLYSDKKEVEVKGDIKFLFGGDEDVDGKDN